MRFAQFRRRRRALLGGGGSAPDTTPSATTSTFVASAYANDADGSTATTLTGTARNAASEVLEDKSWTLTLKNNARVSAAESLVLVAGAEVAPNTNVTVQLVIEDEDGLPFVTAFPVTAIVPSSTGTGNTFGTVTATATPGTYEVSFQSSVSEAKTISVTVAGLLVTDTAAVTVTGASGIVFESDWSYGTGTQDDDALIVTDNGRWTGPGGNAVINADGRTLDVVSASSVGANTGDLTGYAGNVLRMRMREACYGQLKKTDMVPISTSHYIRYYLRSDAGRRSGHGTGHISGATFADWQILSDIHYGNADAAADLQIGAKLWFSYPDGNWYSSALSKATWYRVEKHIEYNPSDGEQFKVHYRVYNLSGTLLLDDDDFTNDGGPTRTLTEAYALHGYSDLGIDDPPSAENARDFAIGLEDPSDAGGYDPATPAYIYVAKLAVSTTGWVGA